MSVEDRLDQLLDAALATGAIPEDATAVERQVIEAALGAATAVQHAARAVRAEADAAMPAARARFQRHLASAGASAATPMPARAAKPHRGLFGGFFGGLVGGAAALRISATAAALGLVVIAAVVLARPFSGVETVSALGVDDYVQVQGVVSETDSDSLTVESSEFGSLRIDLSDSTAIVGGTSGTGRSDLRPGETVLVSGVVRNAHKSDIRIAASTLALSGQAPVTHPTATPLKELRKSEGTIEGTLTVLAINADGSRSRILLDTGRGHQFVVDVDRQSVAAFVRNASGGVGSRVRVFRDESLPAGVFRFEAVSVQTPPTPGLPYAPGSAMGANHPAPALVHIEGAIVSGDRARFVVQTDKGNVPVLVRAETHLVLGQSGLTLREIRAGGSLIGYPVFVRGALDESTGAVVADLILVGAPVHAPAH